MKHSVHAYIMPYYVTTPTRHDNVHTMPVFNLTSSFSQSLGNQVTSVVHRPWRQPTLGTDEQVGWAHVSSQPGATDILQLRLWDSANITDTVRLSSSAIYSWWLDSYKTRGAGHTLGFLVMLSMWPAPGKGTVHDCSSKSSFWYGLLALQWCWFGVEILLRSRVMAVTNQPGHPLQKI